MTPSTKLSLAHSLKKLLQKKFLDDITVKEIVEDCEVNRQTFYYHFQDIYDLLRWFLDYETREALQGAEDWQDALLKAFHYAQANHIVVYHVFRSTGRDHLDCHFFSLTRSIVSSVLQKSSEGLTLAPSDLEFLTDFYMYALSGILMGWLSEDMKEEPAQIVARVSRLLDGDFRRAVEKFSTSVAVP